MPSVPLPPFDPERIPVSAVDTGLPAVAADRLRAAWLRAHLASNPVWRAEVFRDVAGATKPPRPAAVLVPLVERSGGMQLLLTRRNANLNAHAGQISFPGGRSDPEDVDAISTALREAEEEIGLARSAVEPLGALPLYTTITGYAVTPVIGLVDPMASMEAFPGEVDELFEVPLQFLMDPAHHEHRSWDVASGLPGGAPGPTRRSFLAMPWIRDDGRRYFIWGATAAMIRNLYRLLIA